MSRIRRIQLENADGTLVDVDHPLPVDGDSVYPKDINVELSTIGTFTDGSKNIVDLFQDIPTPLIDNSATNPKFFEFTLNRPIESTQLALGTAQLNFSNVVIQLKDLSGAIRGTGGDADNDTKRTSAEYDLINSVDSSKSLKFGQVRIEFHTADPVAVGFVFCQKDIRTVSRIQGLDQNGVNRGAKVTEAGNLRIADFKTEVARGNIPGYSLERKFGSIAAIQASTPADVWAYGVVTGAEKYTFSTTADIDRLSSDNPLDAGIEIAVVGLDTNFEEVIQTVLLDAIDATTPVALPTPLIRVNRTTNANGIDLLGNVYVFVDGATTGGVPNIVTSVKAFVKLGEGGTLQTVYTVPAGKTAFLLGSENSFTKAGGATVVTGNFRARVRSFGKVFITIDEFDLNSSGTSNRTYNTPIPLPFAEKTDFVGAVDVSANGVGASWAVTLLLIDN